MLPFEISNLRFLVGKARSRIFQLALEKLWCGFGLLLAYLQIVRDKQARQFASYLLSNMRITSRIADFECCDLVIVRVTHEHDVYVFAHEFDFFIWSEVTSTVAVEMQLINDQKKAGAAQNLLRNTLKSILQI